MSLTVCQKLEELSGISGGTLLQHLCAIVQTPLNAYKEQIEVDLVVEPENQVTAQVIDDGFTVITAKVIE